MATTNGSLLAAKKKGENLPDALKSLLSFPNIRKRFDEVLGKKANGFVSSLLSLYNGSPQLQQCSAPTILGAAITAATLDLPIIPTLGKAYIVPYKNKATFVCGYKGLIELAQRSGRMRKIISVPVYEGEMEFDRFTEAVTMGEKKSDKVVGYYAAFELTNGFTKAAYWPKDKVLAHAQRFSKAAGNGPWKTDFDAMACKTVLKSILGTYAPMSIQMLDAEIADNTVQTLDADGVLAEEEAIEVEAGFAEDEEQAPPEDVIGRAE